MAGAGRYLQIIGVTDFMLGYASPVSGKITAYFRVATSGLYHFRVTGTNMGVNMSISNNVCNMESI